MVSSGIETVYCIVMASCSEESSNFSPVVTFKFEIEKNHKRNWIKTCLFTARLVHLIGCFVLNILLHRLWGLGIETQKLKSKYEHIYPRNKIPVRNLPVKG